MSVPRQDGARRQRPAKTRLVGRAPELAALADAMTAPAALVLIEGEAGIGKSSLLSEYLAARPTPPALVAYCPPFREPLTLAPVVDAFRKMVDDVAALRMSDLAGALRPLFPEWAADLPPLPEPAEDAAASRHRLFRALAELVDRLGVATVVVEDVHWADEATLEFLLFLASRPDRVRLVLTFRPEDMPAGTPLLRLSSRPQAAPVRRITLSPFDVHDTGVLVSSMLNDEAVSEEFATFLHERTGGVPLAIEESLRLMHQRGDLAVRNGRWVRVSLDEIVVPPSVRDAVLERTERLGAEARAVLEAVAVLGDPSESTVVVAVSGLAEDAAGTGLADAVAAWLLHVDDRGVVSFRHTLASRAVSDAIPVPRRRALHQRAIRALEAMPRPPIGLLARHSRLGGQSGKWLQYAEQAADLALVAGDEVGAATLLSDLLTGSRLPAEVVVRLTKKLPYAALAGQERFSELADVLRHLAHSGDLEHGQEADVRAQLGRVLTMMEAYEEARGELLRAVPHLDHDPMEAIRAMLSLARPHDTTSPAREHMKWLRRAATMTAAMSPVERLGFSVEYATVLLLLGREEGWEAAARVPIEPATAAESLQVARSHLNFGESAITWGHYAQARQRLARAADLCGQDRYPHLLGLTLAKLARLDWLTGGWDGLADWAAAMAESGQLHPASRLEVVMVTALLEAARGGTAAVGQRLRQVLDESRRRSVLECLTAAAAGLARIHLAGGGVGEALSDTEAAIQLVTNKDIWVLATELAPVRLDALLAADRNDEAAALVAAFGHGLRGRKAPAPAAALLTCRATLAQQRGQHVRAATGFARAAAAWEALPRPYDALLARERQAACLLAAGRADDGTATLTGVHDALSALGASGDAARVAQRLREFGVTPRRAGRGGRPPYGDQLSPREAEVLRLLIAGRTDREIAEALYVSPWTVRSHLGSAKRKLNAPSRAALAAAAVEAGVLAADRHPDETRPAPGTPS